MAVVQRFSDFLRFIHNMVPGLEANRVDKQYLAGPSIDGVELSVGVRDEGYSVRIVLTRERMALGEAVYEAVTALLGDAPDVEVDRRPFESRYSVFVFRRDPFASLNRERAREWIAHWVAILGSLRNEIVGGGDVAQWRARALARAATTARSTETLARVVLRARSRHHRLTRLPRPRW